MSVVREGARQCMAWLHGWTGLLLGHVLFIMSLAGTLSLFRPEIGRWMRPEIQGDPDPVRAIDAAVAWLAANAQPTGWYLTAPDGRSNSVEATYDAGAGFMTRALDPVSGAPLARDTLGGEFFYRLHFELELPYPWGRWLAAIAAMTMLVAIVSGVIAHKRFFKDIFTFRPGKGQRSWLDGHNALGALALPFHLMITFTGLVTLASLTMPWPGRALYGDNLTALYTDLTPGAVTRAPSGTAGTLAPLTPMLRHAQAFFGAPIGRVYIFNPADRDAVVTVYPTERQAIGYLPAEISFDGATGRPIKAWKERRAAVRAYQTVYGLHLAHFATPLTRWLYALGGLMLTGVIASGLTLWIVKRRERGGLSIANQMLERWNVGVVCGVPIGMTAYLLANRMLPLGMTGRAEAEVAAAFWSAGGALLVGLILAPRRGWPALTVALALTCALAGMIGPWRGDMVMPVGNLLLLAIAGALGWVSLGRRRAKTAAPRRAMRMATQ